MTVTLPDRNVLTSLAGLLSAVSQ